MVGNQCKDKLDFFSLSRNNAVVFERNAMVFCFPKVPLGGTTDPLFFCPTVSSQRSTPRPVNNFATVNIVMFTSSRLSFYDFP